MYDNTITVGDGIVPIPHELAGTAFPAYNGNGYTVVLPNTVFSANYIGENEEQNEEPEDECYEADGFVRKIIVSGYATIVFWADDTKTVVKWDGESEWSLYTAFTAAFAIKMFGSNSHLKKVIKANTQYHGVPKAKKPTKVVAGQEKDFITGDKVCVRTDLKIGKAYGVVLWTEEREEAVKSALDRVFPLKWLEVTKVHEPSNTCRLFGCGDLIFSFDMLELYKGD